LRVKLLMGDTPLTRKDADWECLLGRDGEHLGPGIGCSSHNEVSTLASLNLGAEKLSDRCRGIP